MEMRNEKGEGSGQNERLEVARETEEERLRNSGKMAQKRMMDGRRGKGTKREMGEMDEEGST